jgi:membrane protein YqaA with SNARE-associated domain
MRMCGGGGGAGAKLPQKCAGPSAKSGAEKRGESIAARPVHNAPRMEAWIHSLLTALALPQFGLSSVFVLAIISATLLPLGIEPAVFGLVKLNPHLFWPAVCVATVGNTIGGAISWWMGYGAEKAYEKIKHKRFEAGALTWLKRFGPKACLLSWLPGIGDPLCALAGWLQLPFWPCLLYMAIGKFLRFVTMTAVLMWWFPGQYTP